MTTTTVGAAGTQSSTRVRLRGIASLLMWEIVPPMLAYYAMRAFGASTYLALIAGALVAGLRALYVLVRERKLDGFAVFLFAFFLIGLGSSLLTGDERFLLAKMSIHTAFAGLVFLGSAMLRRPLTFAAAKRVMSADPAAVASMEARWASSARFRRAFYLITLVWAFGMLAEAVVRVGLIYLLPVDAMVGVSNLLVIATIGGLIAWTRWYRLRAQRRAAWSAMPASYAARAE